MNEITQIHLGRQAFTISVEAYKELEEYLDAIKHRVGTKGKDVVDEVELRIAELLTERGVTGDKVILPKDVAYVKEQLGKPGDFSDDADEETEDEAKTEDGPKRLFRDPEHGMIAGVASGIAAYVKLDVVFVRIAFVVLTLLWGWGIALYIALWLIVPELKTKSDRLRSEGKAVTVSSLKSVVERADVPAATRRVGKRVQGVVQTCARIVLILIGAGFVAGGLAALLGVMTGGAYMLLRPEQAFAEDIFLVNGTEALTVGLALLVAAIVAIFLLLIGVAMIRRKWTFPGWMVATLVGVFLVSVAVGAALTPGIVQDVQQRYEAAHHTDKRSAQPFTKLQVTGGWDTQVVFVPSDTYGIEVSYFGKTDPALITTTVADGTLAIDSEKFVDASRCKVLCVFRDTVIKVTVRGPALERVSLEGTGVNFSVGQPLRQTTPLTLQTATGTYAELRHLYAGKVEWVKSVGGTTEQLTLSNFLPGATTDDYISLSNGNYTALQRTNELYVTTPDTCDPYTNTPLHITQFPSKLVINDKQFTTVQDLRAAQDANATSAYNCVMVQLPLPAETDATSAPESYR